MNKKHTIVLSHLNALAMAASSEELKTKAHAISTRALFSALEPADQGELGGVDCVSKIIDYMSRKGLIENGNSEIIKGRAVLTWVITEKGIRAINGSENNATAQDDEHVKHDVINDDTAASNAETIQPQLLTLDPDHPQDRIFIDIIAQIRAADAAKPAQKIARRQIKIDTLNRLAAITSADIADVLADIAGDLDAIDAEAA